MHWPPDIADDLPAPRDDEPSSLRQDIADELGDHLQCAFTRELHLARDENAAQQKALDRFGDPRAIARKLWFDALRDNIMSQRLTVAALILVTFVSIGSAGATWLLVEQVKKSNEALLAHSQEQNAALIAKLAELAAVPRSTSEATLSPEWNSVRCRLIVGDSPASGFEVTIAGNILDPAKEISVTRISDSTGIVDLGLIRAGQHRLTVKAPWGDQRERSLITVFPGKGLMEEIRCPAGRPAETEVTLRVDWPDDLKGQGLWAVAHWKAEPAVFEGGKWFAANREDECVVVLPPDGRAIRFPVTGVQKYRSGEQQVWPFETSPISARGLRSGDTLGLLRLPSDRWLQRYAFFMNSNATPESIQCESGEYRLNSLLVMRPSGNSLPGETRASLRRQSDAGNEPPVNGFIVMGGLVPGAVLSSEEQHLQSVRKGFFTPLTDWVNDHELLKPSESGGAGLSLPQIEELRRQAQPAFVARDNQKNEWAVPLPPRLLERIRANPEFSAVDGPEKTETENNSD